MRFHCGISFSWRTIKKFLIPILIGVLGCFGFKWINDNKNDLPLGFINLLSPLKVDALSNYNTRYDYTFSDLSLYLDTPIDQNGVKFVDFAQTFIDDTSITRQYTIAYNRNSSYIYFYIFDNNSNYTFNIYGATSLQFRYIFTSSGSTWAYRINVSTLPTDIYSVNSYNNLLTCLRGGSCSTSSYFTNYQRLFTSANTISNDSNNILQYYAPQDTILYYSTFPLHISNTYDVDGTSTFYKSFYINNTSIDVGSDFPTYYDLLQQYTPEPNPNPTPEETNHKALFNKLYWFDDNSTVLGVLSSIYELLFLYCITMILFKIFTIIKYTRW